MLVICMFTISGLKDRKKSKQALKVTGKVAKTQLPIFITIFLMIGLFETFLSRDIIQKFMGGPTGLLSTIVGALVGGAAAGPPAAAFPVAEYMWKAGASHAAVAAFVVAWVSVGTVTLPMEIATFGKRFALSRWGLSLFSSVIIGLIIGVIL